MTSCLFARHALLPGGWAENVRLAWDAGGRLVDVAAGAEPGEAPRAPGPVLPGMPNLHSHAFQRAMAGTAELRGHATDDFWTWREAMYRLVSRLSPEDVEAIALRLYVEMLAHGYTAVAEFHYLHHDPQGRPYADPAELSGRVIAAAARSGIAMTLLPVVYTRGGLDGRPLNAAQRRFAGDAQSIGALLQRLAPRNRDQPLLRLGIAPHSVRAVDARDLRAIVAALDAIDAGAPVHIHASEQVGEVRECLQAHGCTPIEWIHANADVDARWCLVHATQATEADLRRIRQSGAVVGLCPTTEANLGDGIFAFDAYARADGPWGIGGDSHVSTDPLEELRALEYSQRLALRVRNVLATGSRPDVAANLWAAAAHGGAQALGQPCGALKPGLRADFAVLDDRAADLEGRGGGALAVAMFSGSSRRMREVYVAGRRLVADGRHLEEERADRDYRAALSRLRHAG